MAYLIPFPFNQKFFFQYWYNFYSCWLFFCAKFFPSKPMYSFFQSTPLLM